jgi:hemerythrin-like domain-containing protein
MPDVVDKIEHDHREVEQLFAQFERDHDRAVASKICDELDLHTQAEEQAVYPVLKDELKAGKDEVSEAEHEHADAKALISRIRRTKSSDDLDDLMAELKTAIQHHVHEEETEMLPQARAELPGDELEELGEKFDDAKSKG